MNGVSTEHAASSANGLQHAGGASNEQVDTKVLQALELIHNPRSENDIRRQASQYLDEVKERDDAPLIGHTFASDRRQSPVVQHFGLSLIEAAVRHKWISYQDEQKAAVRGWVTSLAFEISEEDHLYVRNKIAQLWVEITKRSWGLDWMDMDSQLVELWAGSVAKKILVLEVLETLSENSFGKEDAVPASRSHDLSKACVDIFTPAQVMVDHFPKRDNNPGIRSGTEGWIWRLCTALSWCNEQQQKSSDISLCAAKILSTLKSVVTWAVLPALKETRIVQVACQSLMYNDLSVLLAAVETLNNLYSCVNFADGDVSELVGPMYETETIGALKQLYEYAMVPADDIDDDKYILCKKFSEMMHNVGKFFRERAQTLPENASISEFLSLLLEILQSESLHVSIPVLHLWAQILSSPSGRTEVVMQNIGPLLEICSQRLIRFELLPEDSTYPAILFLGQDVDTMPERHAFLGNYARFGREIVEQIVYRKPYDALDHILRQTDEVFKNLYSDGSAFDPITYKKASLPALRMDAQCTVVESALAGYVRWRSKQLKSSSSNESARTQAKTINESLEKWALQLAEAWFDDPSIQQRIVGCAVELSIGPLKTNVELVVRMFDFVLQTKIRVAQTQKHEAAPLFNDALKELQRFGSQQLQRISLRAADYLVRDFGRINDGIHHFNQLSSVDAEDKDRCLAVLFVIIQRATTLDEDERKARLETFVEPCIAKWRNQKLVESLQSFPGFCELLGMNDIHQYFMSRNAHRIEDWTELPLDEEGKRIKERIDQARHELPLRISKTFMSASLDRSEPGTTHYDAAKRLWTEHVPAILPNLLHMIGLSHVFSDPATWSYLPNEGQHILRRILRDRFWQVGISSGSRDDFYTKVEQTKTTLEGLASAIRGSLRFVRETSDRLVATLSLLGDSFYSLDELPVPLARALFEKSAALSTHQTSVLIETAKPIIDNCPNERRAQFLTPLLSEMFQALDDKVAGEWRRMDEIRSTVTEKNDLVEEMKDESILRQLTFSCATIVARIFDPNDTGTTLSNSPGQPMVPLRSFVLATPVVLKSVLLFCTHALEMRDSRACSLVTRVLRTVIPEFVGPRTGSDASNASTNNRPTDDSNAPHNAGDSTSTNRAGLDEATCSEIREFLAAEVLRASITSLHEPYFVDVQSDLATLIAAVLVHYAPVTPTPRAMLLQLPGVTERAVDHALQRLLDRAEGASSRTHRGIVLQLLEALRGVSVSEMGRLPKPDPRRRLRSALADQYMSMDGAVAGSGEGGAGGGGGEGDGQAPRKVHHEKSPDFGGVADMFA